MRSAFSVLFGAALLTACEPPTVPLPAAAVALDPPSVYGPWWQMVEGCVGESRDLVSIEWYVVPGEETIFYGKQRVAGYWLPERRRIVLAGEAMLNGPLVRHEMLHALLGNTRGHPRHAFLDRCSGVVNCEIQCEEDAGPAATADPLAVTVLPTDMQIGLVVTPATPGSSLLDGHFSVIVSVTNPRAGPVQVTLPPAGDAGPPGSFSYRIGGLAGESFFDARAMSPEVARFSAGQTRQYIFDFRNRPGEYPWHVAPGTYDVRGAYGRAWAAETLTVVVAP